MIPRALKVAAMAKEPDALLRKVNEELAMRGIYPTAEDDGPGLSASVDFL